MQGSIFVTLLTFSLSLTVSHSAMAQTQRIEAEDYMEMSGIEVELTSDEGGGSNIGWIDVDDWIAYNVR
ncbi:carbohydrate-binding protein [Marinimicrobium sp. C2-29]|uniref:carbohydrate-binding protein n=1 Tax=Marinimicrobium sp. C2-29 TaxID=3139825 RepID=UPI00313A273D